MKIVFFGSSEFVIQVLEQLHQNTDVVTVVSTPDAPQGRKQILIPTPVATRAKELKLPILTPNSLKDNDILKTLTELQADLFIVASYGKIIPKTILSIPKFGVINIHPSLLPLYRGPTPVQTSLINGDLTTGVSLIEMDEQVDHGPLIAQKEAEILPNEQFTELATKLFGIGSQLLLDSINQFIDQQLIPTPQDHSKATFTKILTKADGKITWTQSNYSIYNQFRGLTPWPGIWTTWNNQIIKILNCSPATETIEGKPGTVTSSGKIICGNNSSLNIITVQLSGKQPTDIQSFLRGHPTFINSLLS